MYLHLADRFNMLPSEVRDRMTRFDQLCLDDRDYLMAAERDYSRATGG